MLFQINAEHFIGVFMGNSVAFRIDYLGMTIFCNLKEFHFFWKKFFKDTFGDLYDTERRTAFFHEMYHALAGVVLLANPTSPSEKGDYITLTMKGEACSCLAMDTITEFLKALIGSVEFRITRADLAWDGVDFSPVELGEYIEENLYNRDAFRSSVKRESFTVRNDPAKPNDLGEIGTSSIQFGSRTSSRMIRVYDMHGFTRLEFQTRQERAHLVLLDVLLSNTEKRFQIGITHLLDFIDMSWEKWKEFVGSTERANLTLNDAKEITAKKLEKWLAKQVAPALSVMQDIQPSFVVRLLAHGRMRNRERYGALLTQAEITQNQRALDNVS